MSEIINDDLINFDEYPLLGQDDDTKDDIFSSDYELTDDNNIIKDPFEENLKVDHNEDQRELINILLKEKGIIDPLKIQIEDEDGNISETSFNDLSLKEQLDILNEVNTPELDDNEIETINYLRENNISLEQLIEYQRNLAIQEYLQYINQDSDIENLSDEELYRLDIKSKFDHLSEEEIDIELQKELNNPDLFKKKVDKLREIYTQQEIEEKQRLISETKLEEEQNYQQAVNTMIEIAQDTNELFNLELDDDDKEEVLQFLLTKDINGQSEFTKLISDPAELFKLAWFAKKGTEAFDTIHNYYKKEIDSVRKAKEGTNLTSRRTVVKKETEKREDPYDLKQYLK